MAARDQALFLDAYLGLKKALKRKAYDSDSDSSIDEPTNRGNKLKRRARFVREGQLVAEDGSNVFAEKIEYGGYEREIISHNPPLIDDEGYEIESDDDEEVVQEAIASAAEDNPYSSIHLEKLLAPLTAVTDLPTHPTLAKPYKSNVLPELATESRNWMHKENKALWRVKPLLTKMSGDHIWVDCSLMGEPDDLKLFDDALIARLQSHNKNHDLWRSEDIPRLLLEEGQLEQEVPNGDKGKDKEQDKDKDVEMTDVDGKDKVNGESSKQKPQPEKGHKIEIENENENENEKTEKTENTEKHDKHQKSEKSEKHSNDKSKNDKDKADKDKNDKNSKAKKDKNGKKEKEKEVKKSNGSLDFLAAAADPSNFDDVVAFPPIPADASLPDDEPDRLDTAAPAAEDGFIHPLYLAPRRSRPNANGGLPDNEAEDVRRLLQLWVQKQEEVARGARKLHEGLLKANRLRKTVFFWAQAEGNRDLSDGEDYYDRELWKLTEDLKKGYDEEEEEQVPVKKTRNRK